MKYMSGVGLGLSLVFGCLLLALLAEIYYLLWWKHRIIKRSNEDEYYNNPATKLFYNFCCRKPPSSSTTGAEGPGFSESFYQTPETQQIHNNSSTNKNMMEFNPFGSDDIMPRFLFTIEEETREDLESENGRSSFDISRKQSRSKSLSDLMHIIAETPFLTPANSPPYFTPPLTPSSSTTDNYNQKVRFNPFVEESERDEVFNVLRSSPTPKLKFLREAEDKLYMRKFMEEEGQNHKFDEQYASSSSSQIVPMASCPLNC